MARGLSDLQQWILHQANSLSFLWYSDILVGYYKFKSSGGLTADGHLGGGNHFSRKAVGETRYVGARVAVNRALKRLEKRGLVNRTRSVQGNVWVEVTLSDAGERWVLDNSSPLYNSR